MSKLSRVLGGRFNPAWAGAALVCATLIAYGPSLRAGFVWDDDTFLTNNPLILAPGGLWRLWFTTQPTDYWPVTSTTLWVEWRLWGLHALGYHATNLVLHLGESLLLWAILRRLAMPGAFLGALLFAVHPVNVESVAWITERKNLMAMLFYLASIYWFIGVERVVPNALVRPATSPIALGTTRSTYWLSLLAFILAMLSKGSVAMLPVVLLGLILWHRRPRLRDAWKLAPYFLVAGTFALVNVWFQLHRWPGGSHVGAPLQRSLGAGAVVWFYLAKALLPVHLSFIYPQWHIRPETLRWWLPLLAALGLTGLLGWMARRRASAAPSWPNWARAGLFAWGYFCVSLVPVMGFTGIGFLKFSPVADRYEHLALIAVVALAAAGWAKWQSAGGQAALLAAVAVVAGLVSLTWIQGRNFRDTETLFAAALKENPDAWVAHINLSRLFFDEGRNSEAIFQLQESVRLAPDFVEAHYNLGYVLWKAGRWPEAVAQYQAALRLNPDYAEAHCNLANVLGKMGRQPDAFAHYETALRLKPDYAQAQNNLADLLATMPGRLPEAVTHYRAALRLRPDLAELHRNLGAALLKVPGGRAEAIAQFEAAWQIRTGDAAARRWLDGLRTASP